MRPLELTIEGFRSYRGRTTFDWRGRGLVGIVGPIGAGKSSILDAVSFALFAKTPTIAANTKSLIHQSCGECHVELIFEVDGQTWRCVRALRRKGQAGHSLHLLAADEPGAEPLETITGEKPVTERVGRLLGLDFDAFCRSVLLAQNRFSVLLSAQPAERDKVLKGVFGYERLDAAQAIAKAKLQRAEIDIEALTKEAEQLAQAQQELEEASASAAAASERASELGSAARDVAGLEEQRAEASAGSKAAVAAIETLTAIAATLPTPEEVANISAEAEGSEARISEAHQALEQAQQDRSARAKELAELQDRVGDRDKLRSFDNLVRRADQEASEVNSATATLDKAEAAREQAQLDVAARQQALEDARASIARADEVVTIAEQALADATLALADAQHAEMAAGLRKTLAVGERCPVCDQPVHEVPRAKAAPKVAGAQKALGTAEKKAKEARKSRESTSAASAVAAEGLGAARVRVGEALSSVKAGSAAVKSAEKKLAVTQSQLVEWLGKGDPRSILEEREAELAAAENALALAEASFETAREQADHARESGKAAAAGLAALANKLAGSWGLLGEVRTVQAERPAVEGSFKELREAVILRHEEAVASHGASEELVRAAAVEIAALKSALGLSVDDDFAAILTKADVEAATATARVEQLETRLAGAGELERRIIDAGARQAIARRLSDDLRPSRFLAFLLEEERTELAELGSTHFEMLTDGAYRFADTGDFDVADLNAAGAVRRSDSLSGGESFLASLALALALAQMVARGGGRLDSFFLDEGFGSLDPEHLDKAMEGIGRLVAQDERRLVVLVSHVAEMREAVEDLVVLDKDPLTGDSMVVSGAAPAGRET
jgi:DNA repair protein SbcC/Rad50